MGTDWAFHMRESRVVAAVKHDPCHLDPHFLKACAPNGLG